MSKRRAARPRYEDSADITETYQNKRFHTKDLRSLKAMSPGQTDMADAYNEGLNLMVHGFPGTGKTFWGIYLALCDILHPESEYDQLVIVRSVVPTRDIGFLPGKPEEKEAVYEAPYRAICNELFPNDKGAYDRLKKNGVIVFMSTSFIRGITLNNSIVLVEEVQNMNFHEIDSIITRAGKNTRYIMCGDTFQSDLLHSKYDTTGLPEFMKIIDRMDSFETIEMEVGDIVRSGLVKEYIIAREELSRE